MRRRLLFDLPGNGLSDRYGAHARVDGLVDFARPVCRRARSFGVRDGSTVRRKQQPMTVTQAATLKRLAQDAYEPDAFKPNLTSAEADVRIAMLTAKLKLLGEPPHTL